VVKEHQGCYESAVSTPLVILGCGYVGARLARAALAAGRVVRVCARSTGRLAPLGELGAHIKYLDAALPKQLGPAITGLPGATVVYSLPPIAALPAGQAMAAALQGAYAAGASTLIYFSSAGLYGPLPDDDTWIDEDTPVANDDAPMSSVRADEAAVDSFPADRLRTIVLRLAPVYGPGRGVRERLRKGKYQILDDGEHATSRIHVDDAVRVVLAADERAPSGSKFLVADDEPTTQGAYAAWLCERLGLEAPPSRRLYEPGGQHVVHRNRKIRNTRLKTALGIELLYPSFREGEAAIDAEEAG
jgi:nucleoside-diphosphate-sugar epimerase